MSMLDKLRAEAAALEAEARASGISIKHSAALEEVAKRHGYNGWRACVAAFSDVALSDSTPNPFEMTRYRSSEWSFSLDIPARWNSFPAVPTNSPWEVVRFASHEDGFHNLIVFREPYDPKQSPEEHSKLIQDVLEKQGFSNFVSGKAKIGSKTMVTLDFDKTFEASIWSCRHYFMIDGSTLAYVLGFGSTKWADMNDLFGRMAQGFTIE
ncbi:hypothetical protein V1294_004388 [Bradyrhizobium sp. AZCC 1678]|uniref:glyoxalase superfamily protein n=1 Tax=Bradyrhizobium sp. AZCC 1678 TaxID=3117030 RepID=UPI002FF29654